MRTFAGLGAVFWRSGGRRSGNPMESEDDPPASSLRNLSSPHPIPATRVEDVPDDSGVGAEDL
jgi:hypothetical protein